MNGLIVQHGYALIFANVLIQQLGVPIPVLPTLVLAGALAAEGQFSAAAVFGATLIACAIGDATWYATGRFHGPRVLRLLCQRSVSPDACVHEAERRFERWGRPVLVVTKFVPGLSPMMSALAGTLRVGYSNFVLLDGLGATLWAGMAIGFGMVFHQAIDSVLLRLQRFEAIALAAPVVAAAAYFAIRWWWKRRLSDAVTPAHFE